MPVRVICHQEYQDKPIDLSVNSKVNEQVNQTAEINSSQVGLRIDRVWSMANPAFTIHHSHQTPTVNLNRQPTQNIVSTRAKNQDYYTKNKDTIRAQQQDYRTKKKDAIRVKKQDYRAKKKESVPVISTKSVSHDLATPSPAFQSKN